MGLFSRKNKNNNEEAVTGWEESIDTVEGEVVSGDETEILTGEVNPDPYGYEFEPLAGDGDAEPYEESEAEPYDESELNEASDPDYEEIRSFEEPKDYESPEPEEASEPEYGEFVKPYVAPAPEPVAVPDPVAAPEPEIMETAQTDTAPEPEPEEEAESGSEPEAESAQEAQTETTASQDDFIISRATDIESEDDLIKSSIVDPVSPDEESADPDMPAHPVYVEMIVDEDEEKEEAKPKEKPNVFKFIVIAIVIIVVAAIAMFAGRTYLLQTQLDQGRKYLEEEKFDDATNTFNQALKIFHNSADAYLGLAQAEIGKGNLTGALRVLDEGIDVTGSSNLEKSRENIVDQVFATYVLNDYMINILPGETHQLELTNRSEDMYFDVSWSSDDPSVGTVDENGLVTAVRNGKATIIATVGNDTWGYKDITSSLIVGVVVTYLEEAGCDYVEDASSLPAPCFVYQLDKDGYRIYDGTLEIEQGDATYSLTKCEISDPDTEGMVTYEIEYTVTVPTKFGILADSKESKYAWYYNWVSEDMLLCDDYTGLIFAVQDLYGSDDVIYDSTVSWNGVDYHITGTTENEWVNNEEWAITYSPLTLTTWAEAPIIGTYHLRVKVPKEYQGLVLALDKKGITDYTDPVFDADGDGEVDTDYEYDATKTFEDSYFFDPMEDGTIRSADDFYIIRLTDFATEKGRAASVITE